MKTILLLAFFTLSGIAQAETSETCFSDLGFCMYTTANSNNAYLTQYIPKNLFDALSNDARISAWNLGITFKPLTPSIELAVKSMVKSSQELNAEITIGDLARFSPAETAVLKQIRTCAISVGACSVASLSTLTTGVLGYLGAKATCAWAGIECYDAMSTYEFWKKSREEELKKQRDDEKKVGAVVGTEGPGSSPGLHPGSKVLGLNGHCVEVWSSILPKGHTEITEW